MLFSYPIYAQDFKEILGEIRQEENFPKRSIRCVFQDSEGYLLIGTNSGLYQYDGLRLINYVTNPMGVRNFAGL